MTKLEIINGYPITILDVCCGAGGLCLGLRMALEQLEIEDDYKFLRSKTRPFQDRDSKQVMIVGLDLDKYAVRTFQTNLVGQAIKADMKHVPLRRGTFDFIVGGVPCQGFSTINKKARQREYDPRNDLIFVFTEIVRMFQPLYFMFENVRGLLSWKKGKWFRRFLHQLYLSGYQYEWRLMDAVHYGVPQYRQRVIVLGWMDGVKRWEFPEPTNYCPEHETCLECGPYILEEMIRDYPNVKHYKT